MAGSYLKPSRHGTVFYFRRRVPDDLRALVGRPYLVKSLDTGQRREAIIRARMLAAQTDTFFTDLRAMPSNTNEHDCYRIDFALSWEPFQGGKRAIAHDVAPGEEVAAAMGVATLQAHLDGAPPPQSPPAEKPAGKTLTQAWEAFKAEKILTKAWKDGEHAAKYHHWPHIRDLIEVVGDKPINQFTAEDAERLQQFILADKPAEAARNKDKRLTRAGALLRWAKKKRTWGVTDDFQELFRYPGEIPKNPYLKFDLADLIALFESEDCKQNKFKTASDYWLPVLGLFTGARLNELCQLTTTDVGQHDGVETISILDEELKRLKTEASRRIIPIHSKLIELGFVDYVATIKAGRIFPELPENKVRKGDFGKEPSRKFTDYRRRGGVGVGGGVGYERLNEAGKWEGNSRKTFHSFRSTLISALRKANVPKDRRTRLAGHEYDDTQDTFYTGGDILTMFDFTTLKNDIESALFDVDFTAYRAVSAAGASLEGTW